MKKIYYDWLKAHDVEAIDISWIRDDGADFSYYPAEPDFDDAPQGTPPDTDWQMEIEDDLIDVLHSSCPGDEWIGVDLVIYLNSNKICWEYGAYEGETEAGKLDLEVKS